LFGKSKILSSDAMHLKISWSENPGGSIEFCNFGTASLRT
jgi:hypothetical protein